MPRNSAMNSNRDNALGAIVWLQDHHYYLGLCSGGVLWLFESLYGKGENGPIKLVLAMMALDLATGVLKGTLWQALSSQRARQGLKTKAGMLLVISFGHVIDLMFHTGNLTKNLFTYWVAGVEAISFMENVAAIGVVLPERYRAVIATLFKNAAETGLNGLEAKVSGSRTPSSETVKDEA